MMKKVKYSNIQLVESAYNDIGLCDTSYTRAVHKEAELLFNLLLHLQLNLLKMKRNLLYIRNQSVPRSKHFPPRL